jgi:hypothetical protein
MVRKRTWGVSNSFSEKHRTNLPGNFCLWDVDGLYLSDFEKIESIYEGKFRMDSKDRGNFIETFYSGKNFQANFLQKISVLIPVWICEESTDKWWSLTNKNLRESSNPKKNIINTQDRIYVEDLLNGCDDGKISGIFFRTEGDKNSPQEKLSSSLSEILNCPLILVNDVFKEGSIFIKGEKGIEEIRLNESKNWIGSWKNLGLV